MLGIVLCQTNALFFFLISLKVEWASTIELIPYLIFPSQENYKSTRKSKAITAVEKSNRNIISWFPCGQCNARTNHIYQGGVEFLPCIR
jgi:hypothetical protein